MASHNALSLFIQLACLKPLVSLILTINQAKLSILFTLTYHIYSKMNLNSRNEGLSQPESDTDEKINENAPMITIGAPSDRDPTDTKHQVPKQNPSKTEKSDRGPPFKESSTQNQTTPLFDSQSFETFASLCKSMHAHTIDRLEPLSPIDSENKFWFDNSKPESLHVQPKLATVNEAKSMFTFSARMQGPPEINVTDAPFPRFFSTAF